jgi:hypothetical protein
MAKAKPSIASMTLDIHAAGPVAPPPPAEDISFGDLAGGGGARATINLTVDEDLKFGFKEWCARHRRSQVTAFREAFALLKERVGP